MPEKDDEIKKQAVDIIIAPAEYIKDRYQFDNDISFQVVPVRIARTEHAGIAPLVIGCKNIDEVFEGVCLQQPVFFPGKIIGIPVIISGTVNMDRYPANGNASKDFDQKKTEQTTTAYTTIFYEWHTQQQ